VCTHEVCRRLAAEPERPGILMLTRPAAWTSGVEDSTWARTTTCQAVRLRRARRAAARPQPAQRARPFRRPRRGTWSWTPRVIRQAGGTWWGSRARVRHPGGAAGSGWRGQHRGAAGARLIRRQPIHQLGARAIMKLRRNSADPQPIETVTGVATGCASADRFRRACRVPPFASS